MNSDTKASPPAFVMPCNVPFKILSEQQMEWIQFKARQKLLELKEEEEWKKYCKEQNCSDTEEYGGSSKNLLNSDDMVSKGAEKYVASVPTVQIVDHEKNSKVGTKKPVAESLNKNKGIQIKSAPLTQVCHFQKTRLGNTVGFPVPRKLNVLNVQKNSKDTVNFENFDGEDKDGATAPAVPTRQRIVKTKLPNLDDTELPEDSSEISLYSKANRNVGFTLPYSLRQQRYLAIRAYLPSFSKPKTQCKKHPLPASKSADGASIPKRNSGRITTCRNINSKFQNLSTSQTKKLRTQEKINSELEKEILKENMKSTSVKAKKLANLEKEVAKKVVEFVLNETLDEVIREVEHEVEERRKISMYNQLYSILQKLNDIESEESAIHHKWGTLTVEKPHQENASAVVLSPAVIPSTIPKSLSPVQEKSTQFIVDEIFRETLKNSEDSVTNFISETAATERKPYSQNFSISRDCPEGARCVINPTPAGSDEQLVPLSKTVALHNLNSERELSVTPASLKRIHNYKKSFHQYLKQSSQMSKQHCNFWNVSTETADQILEECLQEIAEELCEIPSSLIVDLYNQEFEHSTVQS